MPTLTAHRSLSVAQPQMDCVDIEALETDALADVIRRADLPHLAPEVSQRLPLYDRPTLVRLAYLARECQRKRTPHSTMTTPSTALMR